MASKGLWMRKRGVSEDSKAFDLRLWKEEVAFSEGKTAGGAGSCGEDEKFSFLPGGLDCQLHMSSRSWIFKPGFR